MSIDSTRTGSSRRLAVAACLFGGMLFAAGCGGRSDLPPVAPVHGVVTYEGQPLPRGMVYFVPTAADAKAPMASGEIGPEGKYVLYTSDQKGALVGSHRVRVFATEKPKDETDTFPKLLIPERYNDEATSGLTYDVKAGVDNEINITLTQ